MEATKRCVSSGQASSLRRTSPSFFSLPSNKSSKCVIITHPDLFPGATIRSYGSSSDSSYSEPSVQISVCSRVILRCCHCRWCCRYLVASLLQRRTHTGWLTLRIVQIWWRWPNIIPFVICAALKGRLGSLGTAPMEGALQSAWLRSFVAFVEHSQLFLWTMPGCYWKCAFGISHEENYLIK